MRVGKAERSFQGKLRWPFRFGVVGDPEPNHTSEKSPTRGSEFWAMGQWLPWNHAAENAGQGCLPILVVNLLRKADYQRPDERAGSSAKC